MARLDDCHRELSHNSRNWLIARDYSSAKATLETERVFAAALRAFLEDELAVLKA